MLLSIADQQEEGSIMCQSIFVRLSHLSPVSFILTHCRLLKKLFDYRVLRNGRLPK